MARSVITSLPSRILIQLLYVFFNLNNLSLLVPLRLTLRPHPSCSTLQHLPPFLLIDPLCRHLCLVCHNVLSLSLGLLAP